VGIELRSTVLQNSQLLPKHMRCFCKMLCYTVSAAPSSHLFLHPTISPSLYLSHTYSHSQRKYQMAFDEVFATQYSSVHRLETNKLRNVAKFFAHLLGKPHRILSCFILD
jgi:hypothetical protein